jgi:hypothetical protein
MQHRNAASMLRQRHNQLQQETAATRMGGRGQNRIRTLP